MCSHAQAHLLMRDYRFEVKNLFLHEPLGLVQKLIGILRRAERIIPLWKDGMAFDGDFAHLEV